MDRIAAEEQVVDSKPDKTANLSSSHPLAMITRRQVAIAALPPKYPPSTYKPPRERRHLQRHPAELKASPKASDFDPGHNPFPTSFEVVGGSAPILYVTNAPERANVLVNYTTLPRMQSLNPSNDGQVDYTWTHLPPKALRRATRLNV